MPTHWMFPSAEGFDSYELSEEIGISFELSENFYGLMGGGRTTIFENFPGVFEQIQQITGVDFKSIMPLCYYSPYTYLESEVDNSEDEKRSWRDIFEVQQKFRQLYDALMARPHISEELILNEKGYWPEREYFENFSQGNIIFDYLEKGNHLELYKKYFPELGEFHIQEEMLENKLIIPDNNWNFGHDVCHTICYLEIAISNGSKKFRLYGR